MLNNFFLLVIGLSSGFIISASIFALFSSLGILSRISDKTHTKRATHLYENFILIGGGLCNFLIVYKINFYNLTNSFFSDSFSEILAIGLLLLIGIFFGIYVGCLAMSLAEVLKVSVVFSRRLHLHKGIEIINVSLAFGKCIGALLYFFNNIFK